MSFLRIFGIFVSLLVFVVIFFRLRRHSESRFDVTVLTVFGVGLLSVSLFPTLVNLPTEILSLDTSERGRLFTLLIISSVALWLLLIYERGKTKYMGLDFDRLVRTLTVERFFNTPVTFEKETVLIVIPVYNEADNLRSLISRLPALTLGKPAASLIVDDGSTDDTPDLCTGTGTPYARNLINRGGGAALRAGFDIAWHTDAWIVVTMDGDGQHSPEDIESLVEPIVMDRADLVIGSRLLGEMEQYSRLRYWGVVLFGRMISMLVGRRITDPASGFRAFNRKILETCVLVEDQYHTAELIIEAAKRGLRIREQPITIKRRISGKSKKGKDFKYALYFLRTILRTWMR